MPPELCRFKARICLPKGDMMPIALILPADSRPTPATASLIRTAVVALTSFTAGVCLASALLHATAKPARAGTALSTGTATSRLAAQDPSTIEEGWRYSP
jgi:hypothetical protein